MRTFLIWMGLALALLVPLGIAATSPLLEWRQPVYIISGLAGVIGLGLMLVQPLLVSGALPGPSPYTSRRIHRVIGIGLLVAVLVHVGGLWITSPPDVIDALTFTSPTPFSPFGVVAMWAVFISAAIAIGRRRVPLRPMAWRRLHAGLAVVIVAGTVVHALLIQGTMGTASKIALSALCVAALAYALWRLRIFAARRRTRVAD